jgi:hypothetical protein
VLLYVVNCKHGVVWEIVLKERLRPRFYKQNVMPIKVSGGRTRSVAWGLGMKGIGKGYTEYWAESKSTHGIKVDILDVVEDIQYLSA